MRWLRVAFFELGALPPNPRGLSLAGQNDHVGGALPPPAIPAAESALELRPRSALSSAQVLPAWTTSTSPCNDLSANGDNPLNFVSHPRGSPQVRLLRRLVEEPAEVAAAGDRAREAFLEHYDLPLAFGRFEGVLGLHH